MKDNSLPSIQTVDRIVMLSSLLKSLFSEMKQFSQKKQDGQLNQLKVKMINKVLIELKQKLKGEPTVEFLEVLDDDTLPQNSDAVLIISQFGEAVNHFKSKYYSYGDDQEWAWNTKDGRYKGAFLCDVLGDLG